jgi:hypothetical protein
MMLGEYEIRYFNKYGAQITVLTETRRTHEDAKQRGDYRIKHPTDIEASAGHYMPHSYQVLRLLNDSTVAEK